jgi:exopolysaccharide biosynthesis polyprenyl glycosylphosphotransferase
MDTFYKTKQIMLLVGDAASLFLGTIFALYIRRLGTPGAEEVSQGILLFSALIFLWIIIHYINGLYDIGKLVQKHTLYPRLLQASIINLLVGIIFFYILPGDFFAPKTILLLSIICGYTLIMIWRFLFSTLVATKTLTASVLFIGNSSEMEELANVIYTKPERGYRLEAWISPAAMEKERYSTTTFYDSVRAIRPSVTVHNIDIVVIADEFKKDAVILREVYELLFWKVHITSLTSLYETLTGRIPPHTFSESWFLDHLQHASHPIYDKARRILDALTGGILFLLLLLLYPFISLAIRISSPGPIIFKQERVGTSGTTFFLYKFRSMYALTADGSAETDGVQFTIKGDERITRVGKFLRKTRIDELPQAINLLKGDVSIIGPRPERPEIVQQLELKMPYYPVRHIIKPGITGWAQINQHYTDTLEQSLQKLQYDLYYIKNRSILLDLSILLKTINVVLRGMGQ